MFGSAVESLFLYHKTGVQTSYFCKSQCCKQFLSPNSKLFMPSQTFTASNSSVCKYRVGRLEAINYTKDVKHVHVCSLVPRLQNANMAIVKGLHEGHICVQERECPSQFPCLHSGAWGKG